MQFGTKPPSEEEKAAIGLDLTNAELQELCHLLFPHERLPDERPPALPGLAQYKSDDDGPGGVQQAQPR